jgi:cell division protein FtsI/penicillin-binding protein 2
MGEIKSALELALERTSSVQGDRKLVLKNSMNESGRKAAFEFLEESGKKTDILEKVIKDADKDSRIWIKEGMLKVFFSNIKLPEDESSLGKIGRIREGLSAIAEKKKEITVLFGQIEDIFRQYLQNKAGATENLKKNYARKLQEKEKVMSQQLGKEVHLTLERDPEYQDYLHKMTGQLDDQYHEVLLKIRDEIEKRI